MAITLNVWQDELILDRGAHNSPDDGLCFMEAAAFFAGEMHSDHPACVSPVLGAFLRNWNDSVDDDFRQKLKPYIQRVIDTANDGKDEVRAWMATDWLVRVCAPAWLDLAKLTEHAMALRTADEINSSESAIKAQPSINAARAAARDAARDTSVDASGDAGGNAAWVAAWDAARVAAWDAARVAAGNAARNATGAAAWDAARDAARDASRDAFVDASVESARNAAWAAARAAARVAAWDAARVAAGNALKPTVELLQDSALALLDRMIRGEA